MLLKIAIPTVILMELGHLAIQCKQFCNHLMGYGGFQSREATRALSCLTGASMSERVIRVTGSSVVLVGRLATKR